MKRKIFRGIFLTALLALITGLALVMGVVYNYYDRQMLEETWDKADYLAQGVERLGADYLAALHVEDRITFVDVDGTVLFDNQAQADGMENHGDREEIREALETGSGSSERTSRTLSEKTVYCALRLSDGRVLRVAYSQYTVLHLFWVTVLPVAGIAAVILLVTWLIAARIAKHTVQPINEINLADPDIDERYEELAPLVRRMKKQNRRIEEHMKELRRQQEEFQTVSDYMQEGLLLVNQKAEILSYNRCIREFFENEEELLGRSALLLNRSEIFREVMSGVLEGKHYTEILPLKGRTYELIANPVAEENGSGVRGAIVLLVDVTEREEREQMRREFTSNVSHELKTPLTSIYGMSDLMRNGLVKPEDIPGFASDIYKEAERMIRLVSDIMKLSKLEEQEQDAEPKPVDLFALAEEVKQELSYLAKEKEINLYLTGEHCTINGNENVLFELLYNLCDNGIRYNRPGGNVRISIEPEGERVRLTVADNGIGIPREHQGRVFERFYRVDKSHSSKMGGTGLGLSIVKHAAAYHHADVQLKSEENMGTTIIITF